MRQKLILMVMMALTMWGSVGCAETAIQLPSFEPAALETATPALVEELRPGPELSPAEVVRIQVEALKENDQTDSGIEITFRFASPANRQVTGPLNRFNQLVRTPAYRPMLNHKTAEYGQVIISGETATQRVTIIERNGQAAVYLFTLSRQNLPNCDGCWMTDGVTIVPTHKQPLDSI
jgi:hypothetical protein